MRRHHRALPTTEILALAGDWNSIDPIAPMTETDSGLFLSDPVPNGRADSNVGAPHPEHLTYHSSQLAHRAPHGIRQTTFLGHHPWYRIRTRSGPSHPWYRCYDTLIIKLFLSPIC